MLPPQVLNLLLFAITWQIYRKCLKRRKSEVWNYTTRITMRILAFNPFPSIPSHAQTVRKIGKSDYRKHDVSQMYQGIKGLEPTQLTFTCSKSAIGTLEKRVEYVSDVILVILRSFFSFQEINYTFMERVMRITGKDKRIQTFKKGTNGNDLNVKSLV